MGDSSERDGRNVIELAGKILVLAIILLIFVVISVVFLYLYVKWVWYGQNNTTTTTRRSRRLDFSAGDQQMTVVASLRRGLVPLVLKTIPVIVFDPKEFKDGLECAVCLCEISEGEKIKLLQKCNHGFHVECIDTWFKSHSACPLCRNPVANQNQSSNNSAADSTSETIVHIPMGENSSVV